MGLNSKFEELRRWNWDKILEDYIFKEKLENKLKMWDFKKVWGQKRNLWKVGI